MKKGYKKLKIWKKAHRFAIDVYKVTNKFPKEELYGLTSQLKRALFLFLLILWKDRRVAAKKNF